MGKGSWAKTKPLAGERENADSSVRLEIPQEKSNFQEQTQPVGSLGYPRALALPQGRGNLGALLLRICWRDAGVSPGRMGWGTGLFRGAASASHRPGVNYPKKPTISFIKAYKGFIKA